MASRSVGRWSGAVVLVAVGAMGCGPRDDPGPRQFAALETEPSPGAGSPVALSAAEPPRLSGTIVFHSDREGRSKLFRLDLRSRAIMPLTTGTDHHDVDPAWSPDGTRVAFASTRFDSRTYDLAVAEAHGGAVRRLTTHIAFDRHPTWAADGRSLFFSSEQDGTQAIFRVALDSGAIARVSPPPDRALMPAAARDGRRLAYTMGTADGLQVMLQDLSSGATRAATHGPEGAAWPAWSSDGSRIAYARLQRAGTRLEVLELATGAVTSIAVSGLAELREPSFSPDGAYLVAAGSVETGARADRDLVLIQLGPPAVAFRLTSGAGNDAAPSWAPR